MVGFARFIGVVMLVLSAVLIVASIGAISEFHGYEQDVMIATMIFAVPMLTGLATIVWNVATIAEQACKRSREAAQNEMAEMTK